MPLPNSSNGAPSQAANSKGGISPRTIAFVVASIALAVACVVLALQYFVAERLPELTEAKLEAAMDRWKKQGPASYDLDLELRGARPGVVHVEVRNGEVTAETRDGRVPGQWTWGTWAVPGMFDMLTQDLQIASNPEQVIQAAPGTKWWLRCEFEPQFGYPLQYHRIASGGPEVFWRVTAFTPK